MTNEQWWDSEIENMLRRGDYYDDDTLKRSIVALLTKQHLRTLQEVEEMVKGYENCEPNDSEFVRGCSHAYNFILAKLNEMKK